MNDVHFFRNVDFGAPQNTNAAGTILAILEKCLVTGYGDQSATITKTGTTANVTVPLAHGLRSDTVMRISGAAETDFNGDFRVIVTSSNTFSYQVPEAAPSAATGSIISKVAPAGWLKPFSGTNEAVFKTGGTSRGMCLKVSDKLTSFPIVYGYEVMTDLNGGTGKFNSTDRYLMKSDSTTPQEWRLVANENFMMIFTKSNGSVDYANLSWFGDFYSNKEGDEFNVTMAMGQTLGSQGDSALSNFSTEAQSPLYVARPASQIGSAILVGKVSAPVSQTYFGSGGFTYPSPMDGALHMAPVVLYEPKVGFRGRVPGLWNPLHNLPFNHLDVIEGSGDFAGKTFVALRVYTSAMCLIEISNTWS